MKKIYNNYKDLDFNKEHNFIMTPNIEQPIIKSLEPMEITIKNSKKETKIILSNRVAEFIEGQDLNKVILCLKDLVKELNKLK